jgi:hypothetical protein
VVELDFGALRHAGRGLLVEAVEGEMPAEQLGSDGRDLDSVP